MAIDGLNEAEKREIATRQAAIAKMKEQVTHEQRVIAIKHAASAAAAESGKAIIGAAIAGGAASWKALKEQMTAKAKGEAVEAVIELAMAAGSFAAGNHPGGVAHMQSAALHGIAAGMAGGTALVAGAMGGGGKKEEDKSPRDQPGMDTYRDVRDSPAAQHGPTYQVAITGTLLGGHPQDIARQINSYLAQFQQESAGRGIPVRG